MLKISTALALPGGLRMDRGSMTAISFLERRSRRPSRAPLISTSSVSEKTSTLTSIRLLGSGRTLRRGLVDTSVIIALEVIEMERLPSGMAVSALTLAELAGGPPTASDASARARRLQRRQRAESTFEALSFDSACAGAYGQVCAGVIAAGRKPGRTRSVDLMIAATALAHQLPLYTLNAVDLRGLDDLIEIVDLG